MDDWITQLVPPVYRFALRLARNVDVAEDITQETFARAWEKRKTLENVDAGRAWILRIALNVYRDFLRRQSRRWAMETRRGQDWSQARRPADRLMESEAKSWLLCELDALPPRQRYVLYLSGIELMSHSEIAAVLGISVGAVKASLSLARKTMRQKLAEKQTGLMRHENSNL